MRSNKVKQMEKVADFAVEQAMLQAYKDSPVHTGLWRLGYYSYPPTSALPIARRIYDHIMRYA